MPKAGSLCHVAGVLVAVGVVDVLPSCMSSKYFFWDPDLAALSLGKVSAMQEISWVAAASKTCPGLKYLYLGYFIAVWLAVVLDSCSQQYSPLSSD